MLCSQPCRTATIRTRRAFDQVHRNGRPRYPWEEYPTVLARQPSDPFAAPAAEPASSSKRRPVHDGHVRRTAGAPANDAGLRTLLRERAQARGGRRRATSEGRAWSSTWSTTCAAPLEPYAPRRGRAACGVSAGSGRPPSMPVHRRPPRRCSARRSRRSAGRCSAGSAGGTATDVLDLAAYNRVHWATRSWVFRAAVAWRLRSISSVWTSRPGPA